MGGKAFGNRRLSAATVDDLMSFIRSWHPWDDAVPYPSKHARARAYARHVRLARKASASIEELAKHRRRNELVTLLGHANPDLRAEAAAVLLGFHTAAHSGRPARWGRADSEAVAAVAALFGPTPSRSDHWAARAHFALDPSAAVDRFSEELSPAALEHPQGQQRLHEVIRATPGDLDGDHARRWHRTLASALTWAPFALQLAITRYLEVADLRELVAALALPLTDETFDRLMGRIRGFDNRELAAWLEQMAAGNDMLPDRAARLRSLAAGDRELDAPIAKLKHVASAGWDGGPMLLLPGQLAEAWEGAEPPSHDRVVDCEYRYDDPDAPATDYDLACESVSREAALIPVGSGTALATPTSYLAIATCEHLDGFVGIIQGEDALVGRWALTNDDVGWRPIGTLSLTDGSVCVQSAALRGGESRGARVTVQPGNYDIAELRFYDERGELHILRATTAPGRAPATRATAGTRRCDR